MSLTQKLFSFDGRLRRRDWWLLSIGLWLASFVAGDLARFLILGPGYTAFVSGLSALIAAGNEPLGVGIVMWLTLAFAWPSFAIAAKRAHDRGKSARLLLTAMGWIWMWGAFQMTLLPLAANVVPGGLIITVVLVANIVSLIAVIYWLAVTGSLDGEPGDNRYGPSPKL